MHKALSPIPNTTATKVRKQTNKTKPDVVVQSRGEERGIMSSRSPSTVQHVKASTGYMNSGLKNLNVA